METKKHTWTDEKIYHFTCGECKNWWSYAGHFRNWKSVMTCPHCGHKADTKASEVSTVTLLLDALERMPAAATSELQIREIVQDEINQIDKQSEPF